MIIRVIAEFAVRSDDSRQVGNATHLLHSTGQRARYFKALVNQSSTEDESLALVAIDRRNEG